LQQHLSDPGLSAKSLAGSGHCVDSRGHMAGDFSSCAASGRSRPPRLIALASLVEIPHDLRRIRGPIPQTDTVMASNLDGWLLPKPQVAAQTPLLGCRISVCRDRTDYGDRVAPRRAQPCWEGICEGPGFWRAAARLLAYSRPC